ncbi:MAG: F0F1 ATP synthase subunit gamma [Pseudomonadota bacterium]
MPNLKLLKSRIKSAGSTKKITKAMQMVAAAKLKKAQNAAQSANPYAITIKSTLLELSKNADDKFLLPELLTGRDSQNKTHLLIIISSDRGLCGPLNFNLFKHARNVIKDLQEKGQNVKIILIGKKARETLYNQYKDFVTDVIEGMSKRDIDFKQVEDIMSNIIDKFDDKQFDNCSIIYNKFISAISQEPSINTIIPASFDQGDENEIESDNEKMECIYEYEPDFRQILNAILPRYFNMQLYYTLLENFASEQGARMAAMDSASRNAGEMIKDLTLVYNRTRQSVITKELIEIISGAESI